MGGIAAGLQLINYKIDEMSFDHNKNTAFILCDQLDGSKIRTSVALRIPQKISGKDEYICGLTMHVEIETQILEAISKFAQSRKHEVSVL